MIFFPTNNHYCLVPLSNRPDTNNVYHPKRKAKKSIEYWRIIKDKYPSLPEPVNTNLFYKPLRINPVCKHCGNPDKHLAYVHLDDLGRLEGYSACYVCGAIYYSGYLPTPKIVAELVCEISNRGYSLSTITLLLRNNGFYMTKNTAGKIIEELNAGIELEKLTPEIVDVIYQKILNNNRDLW